MKIKAITWIGHDFLDAARNEDEWETTKKRLKQAGSWTFDLMLEILKDEERKRLGNFLPNR